MRLLFFSSMRGAAWGGSEELWAAAASAALDDGHEVCVSVFDWRPPAAAVNRLRERGATIVTRPLKPSRVGSWLSRPAWIGELDAFDPEAICLSQGSAYECVGRRSTRPLLAWLEARRVPVVNILQFNEPKRALRRGTRARSIRLMCFCASNGFVAERNIGEAEATLGISVPHARVVRNPVNLTDRSAVPWPAPGGLFRLACVARLHTDAKGQDLLIEALSGPAWRDRTWSLSLYGEGMDRARLEQLVRGRELDGRVVFRGQTSDIRGVWAEHHLLVLPSRAEGTPLAMVEAMLVGRPCVVTDVGGCAEWVREGVDGFVAREASAAAIAEAMERAWAAREHWRPMGVAARSRALELFDPDPGRTVLGLMAAASRTPASPARATYP